MARLVSRRLAARHLRRRPAESLLVVLGSLFGTAIIAASFVVGDSFDASIRNVAATDLGPIDVEVAVRPAAGLDRALGEVWDLVLHTDLPGTDGALRARTTDAVLASEGDGAARRAETGECLLEVDMAEARRFGPDPAIVGLADAGPTPSGDEAVVNRRLADRLDLAPGDPLLAYVSGREHRFVVRQVVDTVGVAGRCGAMVAPGSIEALARPVPPGARPPAGVVWISGDGGVFDGADGSDATVARLEARLSSVSDVEVDAVKADTLEEADASGSMLRTLFGAIGGFSVAAGILLLINLFVMLAEERKVELGMLRAIGLKRRGVFGAFSREGGLYSVLAAASGVVVGIGVGWLVVVGTRGIVTDPADRFGVTLSVRGASLALAAAIGLVISMATVWVTSWRIAHLNVIAAVRDLPDPRRHGPRRGALVAAVAGVVVGAALTAAGVDGRLDVGLILGPALAAFSAMTLLTRWLPTRTVRFGVSATVIFWSLAVFQVFGDLLDDSGVGLFVAMGLTLVLAAVIIATTLDRLWGWLTLQLNEHGRGLAPRLGLAYPLARGFRTGMILGMYSLVIFTMTFVGAFASILETQTTSAAADMAAGFDLIVTSNPANPVAAADLEARADVATVVPLLRGRGHFTLARYQTEPTAWPVTGIDARFLSRGTPVLAERDAAFDSDRSAFEAVVADPGLVIVDDRFLQSGAAPGADTPVPGDRVVATDPAGRTSALRIAGVLRTDYTFAGSIMSREAVAAIVGPTTAEDRHMVAVADGADPEAVARAITADFIPNGAEAQTFTDRVDEVLSRQTAFIRLMQYYLGFGLLIGIAGLGVVMIRAVRERRREIGMLRAMGFPARVVRTAFLVEAGFIGAQAVATGIGLGLLTAYQVAVNSNAFSNAEVSFAVSMPTLVVIAVVPLVASLVAAAVPAGRAAAIRPATALRLPD